MHGSVLGFFAYGALQSREVAGKNVIEVGGPDLRAMIQGRNPGLCVRGDPEKVTELYQEYGRDFFDVVVATEVLQHEYDWRFALLNLLAVLRPGGVLVLTERAPGFTYQAFPDFWRFTQQTFSEIAERLHLQPIVLMDDPEYPGVFVKLKKPDDWQPPMQSDPLEGIDAVAMQDPVKVLGLPFQPDGTGYYRFWQPYAQLQRHIGKSIVIPQPQPPGTPQWNPEDEEVEMFDVVARQRVSGRKGAQLWRHWKGLANLVYETDDHVLGADSSSLPHLLNEPLLETVRQSLRISDMVTTSTEPLAEELRKYNDNVVVIPDFIHEYLLKLERPHRENVTINWQGGENHLQDMMLIQNPLRNVLLSNEVDLHFLGVDYSPIFRWEARFTPWHINVWEYYDKIDGDIGLAPLVDTPFNRCRANIKALEFAALGIPVVASDVEPYREFVVDGETGYLGGHAYRDGREGEDKSSRLDDPERLETLGEGLRGGSEK